MKYYTLQELRDKANKEWCEHLKDVGFLGSYENVKHPHFKDYKKPYTHKRITVDGKRIYVYFLDDNT